MPIVNGDAKALEWIAGTFLSGDVVASKEIWDGVDQHTLNQEAFNLPSRLIAKKFVFRLIFGGTAYTYAHDPDFSDVGYNEKKWQTVIDNFCDKYYGWNAWWGKLIQEAVSTGYVTNPYTGRRYKYEPKLKRGELEWPVTTIKNYIVQGFAADLMSIIRVSFKKRWDNGNFHGKLVNTVHDSIVCDVPEDEVERVGRLFYDVFSDAPGNFHKLFNVEFTLPLKVEVSVGKNMKELEEIV